MNVNETQYQAQIDASCRVPLLVLFGGAARVARRRLAPGAGRLAHVSHAGQVRRLPVADLRPCSSPPPMTRCFTAFAFPPDWAWRSGFSRASARRPLRGALVPVVAAHLWHLGVLVGLVGIFVGDSTGFAWLEFPRGGSALLFFAYLLIGLWPL